MVVFQQLEYHEAKLSSSKLWLQLVDLYWTRWPKVAFFTGTSAGWRDCGWSPEGNIFISAWGRWLQMGMDAELAQLIFSLDALKGDVFFIEGWVNYFLLFLLRGKISLLRGKYFYWGVKYSYWGGGINYFLLFLLRGKISLLRGEIFLLRGKISLLSGKYFYWGGIISLPEHVCCKTTTFPYGRSATTGERSRAERMRCFLWEKKLSASWFTVHWRGLVQLGKPTSVISDFAIFSKSKHFLPWNCLIIFFGAGSIRLGAIERWQDVVKWRNLSNLQL